MVRKVVTVDEGLHLPDAVRDQISADLILDMETYVTDAETAASTATLASDSANTARDQAVAAASSAQSIVTADLDEVNAGLFTNAVSDSRIALDGLYVNNTDLDNGINSILDIHDAGYDIIVLAGQSNASGYNGPVSAELDVPDPRIWQYAVKGASAGEIVRGIDPLIGPPDAAMTNLVGPAMEFARRYVRTVPLNRRVLIVHCAVGSTGLVGQRWGVGNDLYKQTISLVNAAVKKAGLYARVAAFLWVQGEHDSEVTLTNEATYAAALDAMITGFRTNINTASNAAFIIGSMVPEWIEFPHGTSVAVNNAQFLAPTRLTNVYYTAGPRGRVGIDGIHYTAAGARELGRLMWKAWIDPASEPAPAVVSVTDAFDRANNTVSLGVTDTGNLTWLPAQGTWGITGNLAYSVSGVDNDVVVVELGEYNHEAGARLIRNAGSIFPSLVTRYVDLNNFYFLIKTTNTDWGLYRRLNGTISAALATGTGGADTDLMRVRAVETGNNTVLTVYRNNIQVGTYTDSTLGRPAGTKVGLRNGGAGTTSRFNDFAATTL